MATSLPVAPSATEPGGIPPSGELVIWHGEDWSRRLTDTCPDVIVQPDRRYTSTVMGWQQRGHNILAWLDDPTPDAGRFDDTGWYVWDAADCNWWPVDGERDNPDIPHAYGMLEPW